MTESIKLIEEILYYDRILGMPYFGIDGMQNMSLEDLRAHRNEVKKQAEAYMIYSALCGIVVLLSIFCDIYSDDENIINDTGKHLLTAYFCSQLYWLGYFVGSL
jgi:hypothetical protein